MANILVIFNVNESNVIYFCYSNNSVDKIDLLELHVKEIECWLKMFHLYLNKNIIMQQFASKNVRTSI